MLAAWLIVFREVIEAGLIIGVVLAAARGVAGRGRMVSAGVIAGLAGAGLLAAGAGWLGEAFSGNGEEIFEAAVLGCATLMLGWHTVWMARHGRALAAEVRSVSQAVQRGERPLTALGIVVAIAVLREGSEVVLFLYGVALAGGATAGGMIAGGLLGVASGALVTLLIYLGLVAIPLKHMFRVTGGLITLMAAGMAAQAIAFLQQAGLAEIWTVPLWDTSNWLAEDSIAGRLLHTLVGYTAAPDGLQLAIYGLTLAVIYTLSRLLAYAPPTRTPLASAS
jgi:high-affinity iron transporter